MFHTPLTYLVSWCRSTTSRKPERTVDYISSWKMTEIHTGRGNYLILKTKESPPGRLHFRSQKTSAYCDLFWDTKMKETHFLLIWLHFKINIHVVKLKRDKKLIGCAFHEHSPNFLIDSVTLNNSEISCRGIDGGITHLNTICRKIYTF